MQQKGFLQPVEIQVAVYVWTRPKEAMICKEEHITGKDTDKKEAFTLN